MELQATDVACYFKDQAERHADGKSPCLITDAKEQLQNQEEGEERFIKRVARERGDVGKPCLIVGFERAYCGVALFVLEELRLEGVKGSYVV
jgi:hypothetical protein